MLRDGSQFGGDAARRSTKSTTPAAIALRGIPSNRADMSWQKVTPPAEVMAFSPSVPSDAVPERITPIEFEPLSWAREMRNESIGL